MFVRTMLAAVAAATLLSGCAAYNLEYFQTSKKAKPVISEKLMEELSGKKAVLDLGGKSTAVTFAESGAVEGWANTNWYTVSNKLCFRESGKSGSCYVAYQDGHSLYLFDGKSTQPVGSLKM